MLHTPAEHMLNGVKFSIEYVIRHAQKWGWIGVFYAKQYRFATGSVRGVSWI